MPHITGHDGSADDIDFTSFEYQHVQFRHSQEGENGGGSNSGNSVVASATEPLEDIGGLDQNEVAELVAIVNPYSKISPDDQGEDDNQEPGTADFRGSFGLNLDSQSDQVQDSNQTNDGTTLQTGDGGAVKTNDVNYLSDEAVLMPFEHVLEVQYASATNGVGAGGAVNTQIYNPIHYRQMVGRGPILDSADDVSCVTTINKNRTEFVVEGAFGATLVWDIATVDEAGRQFGIPSSMR
jgi:hypothetical protein